jgi:branched-chain amino acid transport system permease protein
MENLVDPLLRGIALGSLFALIASGFALILGVMKIINLVQGEFLMLGGYATYFIVEWSHINPILTIPFVFIIIFMIGILVEQVVDPVAAKEAAGVLLTFGLAAFIRNLALVGFSGDYIAIPYLVDSFPIFGVYLPKYTILNFLVTVVVMTLLFAFLKSTPWGKSIRAISQNVHLAQICGIEVKRMRILSYGIGAGLSGIGGTLLLISRNVHPQMGGPYLGIMFAVVILGGMGDIAGACLGGLIIGLIASFGEFFLSSTVALAVVYLLVPLMLLLRPRGIFNRGDL